MLRAVLDTNVIVSALLHRGPTNRLVEAWQQGTVIPLVSKAILEEYLRVLAYPKFHLTTEEVKGLVEHQLMPFAEPVRVAEVPPVIRQDQTDDIFLACAVAGHARYLVSGDRHLLALNTYQGVTIAAPAAFLDTLHRVQRAK